MTVFDASACAAALAFCIFLTGFGIPAPFSWHGIHHTQDSGYVRAAPI